MAKRSTQRNVLSAENLDTIKVKTPHSLTGRMCAASRHKETLRTDSLFHDPLAYRLAGAEGREKPMGDWVMVPRTRFVDDLIVKHVRRLESESISPRTTNIVLLGAGMDSRAFRLPGIQNTIIFELDQETTFQVKEPILRDEALKCRERYTLILDFAKDGENAMRKALEGHPKFDNMRPTIWILEGSHHPHS